LNGEAQQNCSDFVRSDKERNMGDVSVQRAPIQCLKRLGGPSQLIAQGYSDPLSPVIDREYSFSLH